MLQGTGGAKLVVTLLLVLLSGVGGPLTQSLGAPALVSETPLIWISPTISIVPIGGETCVDIRVQDVQDLFGFETLIQFDRVKLSVIDAEPGRDGIQIQPGPFLQPDDPSLWYVINNASNSTGTARLAITRMAPLGGVSGSGVLATACFRGNIRGHSQVDLSFASTLMLDPSIAAIPFTLKPGGVIVGPVQQLHIPEIAKDF